MSAKFSSTLIPLSFTKKVLVTPYHEIAADTMTFLDILFVELSKFSSRTSDFFPLPRTRSFCRLTGISIVKSFSPYQTVFLVIRMLLSNLSLREPLWVSHLFRVRSLICVVFKCLNCLRFLFFTIFRTNDRLILVCLAIFLVAKCIWGRYF